MKFISFFSFIFIAVSVVNAQSIRSLMNEGVALYDGKKFADAEVNFRKGLEKEPDNFIAHFNLGDSYFKQEKYEDAVKSYQNALSKTNDDRYKAKTHYNIGNSLLKSGKLKESIEAYKNSLKLNPNDNDAKYNISYALKLLQQQQDQQQNKDQNKDQNQDQNKDQNKQEQQNNQDQQDQKQNDQQQKQQQQQEQKMSKEEAERVLNALKENEKDIQKKLRQKTGVRIKTDKDW